ncbi:MAG: hypothetical protein O2788_00155 [Chloroflexi bacterium]|nr:hypothetical protein [Chloroflexota bacterium]
MPKSKTNVPDARRVISLLEEAVQFAETLVMMPSNRLLTMRIGEELIPALYEARTYLEVQMLTAPEIRQGIRKASLVASDLADADSSFAPLYSRLRVLLEEAGVVSRGD